MNPSPQLEFATTLHHIEYSATTIPEAGEKILFCFVVPSALSNTSPRKHRSNMAHSQCAPVRSSSRQLHTVACYPSEGRRNNVIIGSMRVLIRLKHIILIYFARVIGLRSHDPKRVCVIMVWRFCVRNIGEFLN